MKPLKLTIEGIKSFTDAQSVNFTELGKSNIFVICGVTGAGKSTVLDCIILALYGNKSDGLKIEQYINLKSDKGTITLDFEAENGGVKKNYRVTRTFYRSRATKASLVDLDTDIALCEGGDKVSAYIQDMIGLSVTNFTNVIVLEQGKYGEFLKATKKERNEVVGSLFKLERYRDLYKKASDKKKIIDAEIAALDEYLSSVKDITATAIDDKKREIKAAAKREKELEKETQELKKKRDKFAREEEAYRHYSDAREALKTARKDFERRAAELASFEKGASDRKDDEEKLAEIAEKITLARERKTALERLEDTVESRAKAERELKKLRDDYAEKSQKLKLAKADESKTQDIVGHCEEKLVKLCRELTFFGIEIDFKASSVDIQRMIGDFKLMHSASALAENLKAGDVCPVCGSTVTKRHKHVSDEEFDKASKLLGEAAKAAELRENRLQNLIKCVGETETLFAQLEGLRSAGKARSSELEGLDKQIRNVLGELPYELAVKTTESELKQLERNQAAFKKEFDERAETMARLTAEKTRAEGILAGCIANEQKLKCSEPNNVEIAEINKALDEGERTLRELASTAALMGAEVERQEKELGKKREKEVEKKELTATGDRLGCLMKMFKGDKFLEFISQEYILDFCADASKTLSGMSGGCYTMGYDVDKTEFYVRDFRAGNLSRSVGTLSGGETFLASLSLAIAVSKAIA